MGPKVFVSSTYYDLKYVREDLAQFINRYKFEAILFENGDIGYEPGKALDKSCYRNISKSDMVILVIGGLYGSPASGEVKDEFKEYLSVTRKEFQAAKEADVPIYAFVDADVYAEYAVYQENREGIEKQEAKIKFKATKDINVFRFIESICNYPNVVINGFKRTSDIKEYLGNQWAEFFLYYLEQRRQEKKNKEIEDSLGVLKRSIDKINLMIDEVGKKVLEENDGNEYVEVKKRQFISDIKNVFIESFDIVPFYKTEEEKKSFATAFVAKVVSMIKDKTFYLYLSADDGDVNRFQSLFHFEQAAIVEIKNGIENELNRYLNELEKPDVQKAVVRELLSDDRFLQIKVEM